VAFPSRAWRRCSHAPSTQRGAKAVALAVNSPGGSPVQSALIGQRIRLLAAEKDVKVIAFVEDVAASGGYWLACAADEIIVDPSSIVGSIGVISAGFGFQDLIARYGVERRVHTSGERKRCSIPSGRRSRRTSNACIGLQAEIHDGFKDWVRDAAPASFKATSAPCSAASSGPASAGWSSAWSTASASCAAPCRRATAPRCICR
jgi:ClpP class serine protease